jgi:diphthamide synthase subunit DPH2
MDADRNNEIDYDDRWLEIVYEESFGEADKRIISWGVLVRTLSLQANERLARKLSDCERRAGLEQPATSNR